mgnify:CR=1 FL=1
MMSETQSSRVEVLKAVGITKVYRSGTVAVDALKGVDLALYEREIVALLGASGSGKSTLLNILGGLDLPTDGRLFYRGRENVALVTEIAEDAMTPEEALDRVGLASRMDHFPAELSGGEQQRVAIARAIAKRPDILLCDEPTGALDSKTGVTVLEAIVEVNRTLGTTTALITHNVAIRRIADRVIYMADGEIARAEENADRLAPAEVSW